MVSADSSPADPSGKVAPTGQLEPAGYRRMRLVFDGDLGPATWAGLDDLHIRTGVPVTARRPWLQTWIECYPSYRPLVVLLESDDGLAGAALLARRRRFGLTHVRVVGHGPSDQVRFPVLDPAGAAQLAAGIVDGLRRLPRPWRLDVEQLPPGDPVAAALTRQLPWAQVRPGVPSPTVRFTRDRRLRSYASRNHHQANRRLANRVGRAGLTIDTNVLTSPAEITALLPELERVCRARDHQLGRLSEVDDPEAGPFFRAIIGRLAERGEVALTTLRLGDGLASYVLSFVDGSAHRMWNTRFEPALAPFGLGRLATDAALNAALANADVVEFDWMRGDDPYKLGTATDVVSAIRLVAWSSRWAGRGEAALRRAKGPAQRAVRGVARGVRRIAPRQLATGRQRNPG
jgi:CelD/BcsL family acetyltransferase involved in cellulose biosynthesis